MFCRRTCVIFMLQHLVESSLGTREYEKVGTSQGARQINATLYFRLENCHACALRTDSCLHATTLPCGGGCVCNSAAHMHAMWRRTCTGQHAALPLTTSASMACFSQSGLRVCVMHMASSDVRLHRALKHSSCFTFSCSLYGCRHSGDSASLMSTLLPSCTHARVCKESFSQDAMNEATASNHRSMSHCGTDASSCLTSRCCTCALMVGSWSE